MKISLIGVLKIINMLITFFHLNAFFPLQMKKTVVEYIYNGKRND